MSTAVKNCVGAACAVGLSATLVLSPLAGAATPQTRLILGGVGYELAEVFPDIAALPLVTRYVTPTRQTGAGFFPASTPVLIDYPSLPFPPGTVNDHIAIGADRLDAAIAQRPGPLAVVGHSEGSMVLDTTRARLENNPDAPEPDQLQFVLFASPTRGLLSTLFREGARIPVVNITVAAPVASRYDTAVVIHEYDFWADFPDRPWNVVSLLNAALGMTFVHSLTNDVAAQIAPENITSTVNSKGATDTTYFVPTPTLPLTEVLRIAGVPDQTVDVLDDAIRPIVDAGYSRNDKPGDPRPYLDHGVLTTHAASARPVGAAAGSRRNRALDGPAAPALPAAAEQRGPQVVGGRAGSPRGVRDRPGSPGHQRGTTEG